MANNNFRVKQGLIFFPNKIISLTYDMYLIIPGIMSLKENKKQSIILIPRNVFITTISVCDQFQDIIYDLKYRDCVPLSKHNL